MTGKRDVKKKIINESSFLFGKSTWTFSRFFEIRNWISGFSVASFAKAANSVDDACPGYMSLVVYSGNQTSEQ